ncbi:hypothetical protein [Komagataeibacter oboediens]|uniref:Uncharacterized protein n=1 Tax=Komagataeibacter oboediens TaxID=65958 RepID=A0A318QTY2_9PROT|nr:hypothetical protein [Komagataeibacter oboediens]MBL7232907.1 hypothetical protein [Komagataeibacter oboediens]MBT0674230.1 hypothetical protein [Komagataeibacter oboediens]MBT0679391.1 hypothetical protein [Komagataeibacter oboediens]MBV1823486.1 hypothetical protein [Komagataeibacter oboediens]PYD83056.1 hypothetical protein CFR80_03375 [Komagataeibacter oboediens]
MTENLRLPWADLPPATAREEETPAETTRRPPGRRGRRPLSAWPQPAEPSPWQWWHLLVYGPDAGMDAFVTEAAGPGLIPWPFDAERVEEDMFALAIGANGPARGRAGLSIDGCRILARQFRAAAEARHARLGLRMEKACPLDFHQLVPVPERILHLGATHPDARAWLHANWGLTEAPRQVRHLPGRKAGRRLPRGHRAMVYGFFTRMGTPAPVVRRMEEHYPTLTFRLSERSLA